MLRHLLALWAVPLLTTLAACGSDSSAAGGAKQAGGAGGAGAGTSEGGNPNIGGAGAAGGEGSGGAPQTRQPRIGAHGLAYFRYGENQLPSIDAPALKTQPSGSTLVASAGRGDFSAFAAPTDNKGNSPYVQLGTAHTYTNWPTSGTAVYSFAGALGGSQHVVSNSNAVGDEITFAVVEVMSSSHVQDSQWVERLNGSPITSLPVTTTGPATLVAFWWGDGGADGDKVAIPDNGFEVLDSIGLRGSLVQCFVAAKEVDAAGTYDVTWDATPAQGAQLWLIAVQ